MLCSRRANQWRRYLIQFMYFHTKVHAKWLTLFTYVYVLLSLHTITYELALLIPFTVLVEL